MRAWPFNKPKTPGFGISQSFYYSVLSSSAQLPRLRELANPKAEDGAVAGLPAKWHKDARREEVDLRMERGIYLITTPDLKTAVKLMVVPKEEAGFDPEAFLRSSLAAGIDAERTNRIRATWTLLQLSFASHDPMVYPAIDFMQQIAVRAGALTDGVIADPVAQRYLMPEELILPARSNPLVDAREHVSVGFATGTDGMHAFTAGMQKFVGDAGNALPEFEIYGLEERLFPEAEAVLAGLCQAVLLGKKIRLGDTVGSADGMLEVRQGGLDRARWEGIAVFELIPPRGKSLSEAIQSMARE
ncbi:MAG: hypothetical protein WAO58_10705 [Fimbriimonadaceae bacterium]